MMPTPNNPTPAEIVRLECDIAEGVMRWHWCPSCTALMQDGLWLDEDGDDAAPWDWSPWNNAADALAVLKRVQTILQTDGGNLPDFWIRQWWEDTGEMYGVQVGDDFKAVATGDHFGPAVCRLAEKVIEGR